MARATCDFAVFQGNFEGEDPASVLFTGRPLTRQKDSKANTSFTLLRSSVLGSCSSSVLGSPDLNTNIEGRTKSVNNGRY
jgi:hypothetical protein